jgi:hypothetical protein
VLVGRKLIQHVRLSTIRLVGGSVCLLLAIVTLVRILL